MVGEWLRKYWILLVILVGASSALEADVTVLQLRNGAGASDRLLEIDLGTGRLRNRDVQRGGQRFRVGALQGNLLEAIGRQVPAGRGELLVAALGARGAQTKNAIVVEASTGYVAIVTDPGDSDSLGQIRSLLGRPTDPIAAPDSSFLLLSRQDRTGRTAEIWLVHPPSGKCMVLAGFAKPEKEDPTTRSCTGFPALGGRARATELLDGDGATRGWLVVGPAGELLEVTVSGGASLASRALSTTLPEVFASEAATGGQFRIAGVGRRNLGTDSAVALDTSTGAFAILSGLSQGPLRATLVSSSVARVPPAALGRGDLQLIPQYRTDADVEALWVIEEAGPWYRLTTLEDPLGLTLAPTDATN